MAETEPRTAGITVFTSADPVYLSKFGRSFIASLARHSSHPRLHIHIFNPDEDARRILTMLRNEFPTVSLSWSAEQFNVEDFTSKSVASPKQSWRSLYICCARFLAAQKIQDRLRSPILMTDIDILFNGDIAKRFFPNVDLAIMTRPGEKSLRKKTLGGVVYVSDRLTGRMFLDQVCKYIRRFLGLKQYWVGFDQYALYRALQYVMAHNLQGSFSELTDQDVSFELNDAALILFPKGSRKHEANFDSLARKYAS